MEKWRSFVPGKGRKTETDAESVHGNEKAETNRKNPTKKRA